MGSKGVIPNSKQNQGNYTQYHDAVSVRIEEHIVRIREEMPEAERVYLETRKLMGIKKSKEDPCMTVPSGQGRKPLPISESRPAVRVCLGCDEKFDSEGPWNRFCLKCSSKEGQRISNRPLKGVNIKGCVRRGVGGDF